jgi:hypothetical protein
MSTFAGVGLSKLEDSQKSGEEAARQAFNNAGITEADFVFVVATMGFDQELLLKGVKSVTSNALLVGCSAFGIVPESGPDENLRRVEVFAVKSDKIKFTAAYSDGLGKDSKLTGVKLAEKINAIMPSDSKVLLLLADGLTINPDGLFAGLETTLAQKLPFVGGTAGETLAMKNTYQYFDTQVMQDSTIGVVMSGDFKYDFGVSHGSRPVGIELEVTKAEGNRLYELDHKPAFEVIQEYVGIETKDLVSTTMVGVCLGVETPPEVRGDYEEVVLKLPLALIEKDKSLIMAAEWPVGTKIHLCQREPETVVKRAKEIADNLNKRNLGKKAAFVFNFDCTGRAKAHLGADTSIKEVAANRSAFAGDLPWFGFYTFGEIAPISGKNLFHNWTSVLFAVFE